MSFFSTRTAALLISIIWMIVIAASMPVFLWYDVVVLSPVLKQCRPIGVSSFSQAIYSLIDQVALFYVPLTLTLASYFGIWYKMYFAKKKARNQIKSSY